MSALILSCIHSTLYCRGLWSTNAGGDKLFQLKNLTKKSIFYKIAIKSLSKDLNYKNVIYNIDYYDKHKFKRKTVNFKNFELFRNFKFIKTTGTHVNNGFLMTRNFSKIKKKDTKS